MPDISYYQVLLNECIDVAEHQNAQKALKAIFESVKQKEEAILNSRSKEI